MHQLGYDKYVIQGGDLGSHALRYMAVDNPQTVSAIHTNLWYQVPTIDDMASFNAGNSSNDKKVLINVLADFQERFTGQREIQEKAPLQLAIAMTDSAVGHAAWIWYEMHFGSPSYPWRIDEIITWSMMYQSRGLWGVYECIKNSFSG